MKTKILTVSTLALLAFSSANAKEIEIPGNLKSSSTTKSGSSNTRTDSYTCSNSNKVCFTITIKEVKPDSTSNRVRVPFITEGMIEVGQEVSIIAEGTETVSGFFVSYDNEPVLGDEMTTRTHKITLKTN